MPEKAAPQFATLVSAPPVGDGWAHEIKFDGYRVLARCKGEGVRLFTRNGNDWTDKMANLHHGAGKYDVRLLQKLPTSGGHLTRRLHRLER